MQEAIILRILSPKDWKDKSCNGIIPSGLGRAAITDETKKMYHAYVVTNVQELHFFCQKKP